MCRQINNRRQNILVSMYLLQIEVTNVMIKKLNLKIYRHAKINSACTKICKIEKTTTSENLTGEIPEILYLLLGILVLNDAKLLHLWSLYF